MNDHNPSEPQSGPGHLADFLAELLKQFRHFSSPVEPIPEMATQLARIKVAARLLSALQVPSGPVAESFVRLGGVLEEWVAFFDASPESYPHHLTSPLEQLADYLEDLMARRDKGVSPTELAGDDRWGGILASFRHAGTPLAVLEDVESLFRKWNGRWTDQNLTPLQEQQLRRRWLSLRMRGDVLFYRDGGHQAWAEDVRGPAGDSPEILLLVDSSFRRDQIRDKLTDRGFRVEIPCDPTQALEFLASGPAPQAILCDHLEPTRHLACVTEGLSRMPVAANIPLVLVVGSSLAGPADQERAFSLGAVAAWREPFDPMDLKRILQRLAQP